MQIQSRYCPPFWLTSCHIQTIVGTWIDRNAGVTTSRERIELPDGDFLDIDWLNNKYQAQQPTLIILHGLEGSIESSYIQGLLKSYQDSQWRIGVMHFRGCSGVPNRMARSYHSGDTTDLDFVLRQLEHDGPLYVAGFSLGGNVLLKYLGEQGLECIVDAAIAVSVPFDLADAAVKLDQGLSKLYRWYLLRDVKQKAGIKRNLFPEYDWITEQELAEIKSFVEFDHKVTAAIHGFRSGQEYYERCSCGQFLKNIRKPTLIIHAKDDPFMTRRAIPTIAQLSSDVTLELADHGGHMGFVQQESRFKLGRYTNTRVPDWFTQQLHSDVTSPSSN